MMRLAVEGEHVHVEVDRVVNLGFSGRDEAAVQAHIDEMLAHDAIPGAPDAVPQDYQLAPYTLLVDPGRVQVVGADTSGEAEYGLVVTGRDTYVVAASDQTDRVLERRGIQPAKQIAPNVVSRRAWRLDDVRDHWDDVALRAHVTVDGERRRYQDTTLAELVPPERVLEVVRERYGEPMAGTVALSGTVATVDGQLTPGERFEVALEDPVRERSLEVGYDVEPI